VWGDGHRSLSLGPDGAGRSQRALRLEGGFTGYYGTQLHLGPFEVFSLKFVLFLVEQNATHVNYSGKIIARSCRIETGKSVAIHSY
jgi:hypothetical protein